MESCYRVQTPLIFQDQNSLTEFNPQSWSQVPPFDQDTVTINLFCSNTDHLITTNIPNTNNQIHSTTSNSSNEPTNNNLIIDPNFEFNFDLANEITSYQAYSHQHEQSNRANNLLEQQVNLDLDLKNVLNEIESISSGFLTTEVSSSPSTDGSLMEQELVSPQSFAWCETSLACLLEQSPMQRVENSVATPFGEDIIELSPSPSSEGSLLEQELVSSESLAWGHAGLACLLEQGARVEEKVDSSGEDALRQVKTGRVNKRESNKIAAVRYRAKKTKQRDMLFKECEVYAEKNAVLKVKISDIEQEIGFIKNLLVQALTTKK